MNNPDPTEEEPKPTPEAQPKREPRIVVHRGMTTQYPAEADRKPASAADTSQPPTDSTLQPESQADLQAEPSTQAESRIEPGSQPASEMDEQPNPPTQVEEQIASETQTASSTDLHSASPRPAESANASPAKGSGFKIEDRSAKGINPGLRLRALEASAKRTAPAKIPLKYRLRPKRELTHRAFWDVTAVISLVVNVILVSALVIVAIQLKNLKTTVSGLLSGVYSNLVDMDQASINTNITVEAQIPLNFTMPIQQNTNATLTNSLVITDAYIVLNSIDVPVNFSLPAGTNLALNLNTSIPVEVTAPISLQIPVHIPLNQTNLQAPLDSLQTTIQRVYCTLDENAQYPTGVFICAEHDLSISKAP